MTDTLYSIRMRASLGGRHIAGAERIVSRNETELVTGELVARAMTHERGTPDSVAVTVDSLAGKDISRVSALPVRMYETAGYIVGRAHAVRELARAGVTDAAARAALGMITGGASATGVNMRGAMVIDAETGKRLEPDKEAGVRARSVDYDPGFVPELKQALVRHRLDGTHFREALALATKVAHAPGIVAELCISDDPSYVTGYAASPANGYARITPLKETGDPMGGRAFFVDAARFDMDAFIDYMRETPVLVTGPLDIR